MATSNFRKLYDYNINKSDWKNCAEHLELFLTANYVEDVQKREFS